MFRNGLNTSPNEILKTSRMVSMMMMMMMMIQAPVLGPNLTFPKDLGALQWKGGKTCIAGVGSSKYSVLRVQ